MQEQHFQELKDQMGHLLSDLVTPENYSSVQAKTSRILDQLVEDNKLMTLPQDEYQLLLAYRLWKKSPKAVENVFHWKKY